MLLEFLKNKNKYIIFAIFIIILYLSYLIIKPFIDAILISAILVYMFYPIYNLLLKHSKNKTFSSFVTTLFIILIIIIPIFFIIKTIALDAYKFYNNFSTNNLLEIAKGLIGNNEELLGGLDSILKSSIVYLFSLLSNFIINLPGKILEVVIIIFSTFFLFKDGEKIFKDINDLKVMDKNKKEEIINNTKFVLNAIIHGVVLTGLIEGILLTLIFWILGIPNALFWGMISVILAILPVVGAGFVWVPASIWLLYKGKTLYAVILILFSGVLISGIIEQYLKPKIIGEKSKIHPLIILIGILGGIKLMGLIGMVIGPLIISFLGILYKSYVK